MDSAVLHFSQHLQFSEETFFLLRQVNPALKMELTVAGDVWVARPQRRLVDLMLGHLKAYVENTGPALVFDSSTGFRLPNNGATRSPDAAWIAKERWEALSEAQQEKFPSLCPDFVVELKSESDPLKATQEKMGEWLENGCRLGWLLDPQGQKAYAYRPGKAVSEWEGFTQRLSGEDVLPGFQLDLALLR
jgi:Uma2 family endonuclease